MKFKVGDRIRIRKWSDMEKEFGLNEFGSIACLNAFTSNMKHLCGRTGTLTLVDDKIVRIDFDDNSGGVFWSYSTDMIEPAKPETIVIYQKNDTVVAKNTATGEKAVAKCHPDDEFDFKIGAGVAFDRLMGREVEKPKFLEKFEPGKTYVFRKELHDARLPQSPYCDEIDGKIVKVTCIDGGVIDDYLIDVHWCEEVKEEPKKVEYFNGKAVCINKNGYPSLTVGKIYEFKDGRSKYDDGLELPCSARAKNIENLNSYFCGNGFIEVVE